MSKTVIVKEVEFTKEELEKALASMNEPEFDYPLAFKSKMNAQIVLFSSLNAGVVLKKGNNYSSDNTGYSSMSFIKHTRTDIWEPFPYDRKRKFYHGQPVWCWDDDSTHGAALRYYDAINQQVFNYKKTGTAYFHNCIPYEGKLPPGMQELEVENEQKINQKI